MIRGASGLPNPWSRRRESNPQPRTYKDRTLPIELRQLIAPRFTRARVRPPSADSTPCTPDKSYANSYTCTFDSNIDISNAPASSDTLAQQLQKTCSHTLRTLHMCSPLSAVSLNSSASFCLARIIRTRAKPFFANHIPCCHHTIRPNC